MPWSCPGPSNLRTPILKGRPKTFKLATREIQQQQNRLRIRIKKCVWHLCVCENHTQMKVIDISLNTVRSFQHTKKRLRDRLIAEKAKTRPAKSTYAPLAQQNENQQAASPKTAGLLSKIHATDAWNITLKDNGASLACVDCFEDGADDLIVSSRLLELAALKVIGSLKRTKPVKVQAALKDAKTVHSFMFSRERTVPRTIL